jgi:hypothetical protein
MIKEKEDKTPAHHISDRAFKNRYHRVLHSAVLQSKTNTNVSPHLINKFSNDNAD